MARTLSFHNAMVDINRLEENVDYDSFIWFLYCLSENASDDRVSALCEKILKDLRVKK